jgi:predicted ester cyclase
VQLTRTAVERYIAAYVTGDTSQLAAIIAPNFVNHTFPAYSGIDGVAHGIAVLHTGLSEVSCRLEQCVCDTASAAFRVVASGRHTGVMSGHPPTGNVVTWAIADFVRLEDGKFVELWTVQDSATLFAGLGAIAFSPSPQR